MENIGNFENVSLNLQKLFIIKINIYENRRK